MKKSPFGVAQIIGVQKEADAGVRVGELCRKCAAPDET